MSTLHVAPLPPAPLEPGALVVTRFRVVHRVTGERRDRDGVPRVLLADGRELYRSEVQPWRPELHAGLGRCPVCEHAGAGPEAA